MMTLNPYIRFEDTCREAMEFYKECLGGELTMQTVGESPMAETMPEGKDKIMHATLTIDGRPILMGSDLAEPEGYIKGNTFVISLNFDSETELREIFKRLSEGGNVTRQPTEEFWGGIYGSLTDKYGVPWMCNYQKTPIKTNT